MRKISLALSGGGIRASIFHLGVLHYLAENDELEHIAQISSVSGASLAVGLIYAHNEERWPSSSEFLKVVLPRVRTCILKHDIQTTALLYLLSSPWNWDRKVNLVAEAIEDEWGIHGRICDLPAYPLWSINCTTFETGKSFRITPVAMGDYKAGFVKNPTLPISDAIAASAGFPILIGPYKCFTKEYQWLPATAQEHLTQNETNWPEAPEPDITPEPSSSSINGAPTDPPRTCLHLWDGGVYDNLGLEALYKISGGGHLTGDSNYLIVSNASSPSGYQKRRSDFSLRNLRRLLDISMDQVTSLRSRDVVDFLTRNHNGLYLRIGTHADRISSGSPASKSVKEYVSNTFLTPEQVATVKNYPTTLLTPSEEDFDLILQHGYETAKCTAMCYE